MTRSRRGQGRNRSSLVSACLIALVSAVATCGNAVWTAPPRFDGAGYAVLARAWMAGQGYRAIDHPDRPRHAHFPPGYPLLLASTWWLAGESVTAAHVVSVLCTVGASLAAWMWFRRMMAGPAATLLGLALAVNWLWARTGSAIQSEPLYLLLGQLTILAAIRAGRGTLATRTRERNRSGHAPGRLPADPTGCDWPGGGGAGRPVDATGVAGCPGRRGDRRPPRLPMAGLDGDGRSRGPDPGRPARSRRWDLVRADRRPVGLLRASHPRPGHGTVRRGWHRLPPFAGCGDRRQPSGPWPLRR